MKRITIINSGVVLFLIILTLFTLAPLFLMFHTSLKPVGTLTMKFKEITLISEIEFNNIWQIRFNQDMRKFSTMSLLVKGNLGGEQFDIILYDINGRWCFRDSGKYLKNGLTKDWQRLIIPIKDFSINILNKDLPEKIAEFIVIKTKNEKERIFIGGLSLNIKRFTLANYLDVLTSGYFGRYFFNSTLIAIIITLGNLFFCTLAGYAFARKDFAFKRFLFLLILASIMIPPQVLIVPIFILMKNIGWLNTYLALIAPSLVQPFGIFLMRQYILNLPTSLEDQARVDGATEFQILFKIIFPLSRPALAIVGINTFMGAWNTFLFPFILTNTSEMRTLPVGLALFKTLQGADWVHLMAGSGLTALPVILVFLGFQKHIIAGLTTGLVKR
ncbi:MAG: carbohydrate ABC transporter permease [Candidatus Omnitrophica bacterium]|nr:carbohydrate ABC transporter permease [Candidatus Omnitrophota bacterium]